MRINTYYLHKMYSAKLYKCLTLVFLLTTSFQSNAQCFFTLTGDTTNIKTCKYALENVVWSNLTNTAAAQNDIIKTAGGASWNADAISVNKVYNNGFMQTIVVETNTSRMIGLNSVNSNTNYPDLEYAFYLVAGGSLNIYENGSSKGNWGSYFTGDTLRIAVMNNTVFYLQNSKIIYTSLITPPTLPMFVDMSINTVGGTLQDVVVGNGTETLFTVFEANPGGSPTYQWKLNGLNVGANQTTYTNNLSDGDKLECVLTPSLGGCSGSSVVSNELNIKELPIDYDINYFIRNDSIANGSCLFTTEDVAWNSLSGVDINGINNLIKTANSANWDAGAFSFNKVQDGGYLQTIVNETTTSRMIGLNATNTSVNYTDIDYAFYLVAGGSLNIYENGSSKGNWGAYSIGDTLRVAVVGNTIRYLQNGNIVYTSITAPSLPLFVDMSLNTVGSTLEKITISNTSSGKFIANVNGLANVNYQWILNGVNVGGNSPIYNNTSLTDGDSLVCEFLIANSTQCGNDTTFSSNIIRIEDNNPKANLVFAIRNDSIVNTSCKYAYEQVAWQSLTSIALTGINNITKVGGSSNWDAGAFSYNKVQEGGFMETVVNETTTSRMIGLNAINTSVNYTDIDYAFYLVAGGSLNIYENGSSKGNWGSYSTGDTLRVAVVGNTVRYIQNGNIVYTSLITPSLPLFVDMSLNTVGATLENIYVNNTTFGIYTAFVTGASTVNYQWKLNGVNVGANSATYTNTTTTGGDTITCNLTLTNALGCSADTIELSNKIIINEQNLTSNVLYSIRNDSLVEHSCLFANEQVAWQSLTALTTTNINNVTKTGSISGWNAGAFSYNKVTNGGFMQTIVNETTTSRMIGLNATNTSVNFTDIDYAFYLVAGGSLIIYENGSNKATLGGYSTGDTLRVAVLNNIVKYYQNSNLVYTSLVAPNLPLYVDMSLNTIGSTLEKITVYNGMFGNFSAFVDGTSSVSYQWKLNGVNVGANSANYSNFSLADGDTITSVLSIINSTGCNGDTIILSNKIEIKEVPFDDFVTFYITREATQHNGCQYAVEDVRWNILSGVSKNGNNITKTLTAGSWNAGAFSFNNVDNNGFLQFTIPQNNKTMMVGLNATNQNFSYTDIDYAIYFSGSNLLVYENGSNRGSFGSYAANDTFRIDVINNVVHYVKNNNVFYTSAIAPNLPLYVDMSFNTNNGIVNDFKVGNATHGNFVAITTDAGNNPVYQWKLNGINVGANSPIYSNNEVDDTDEITCILTPDYVNCSNSTITSNKIVITDNPPLNFIPIFTAINSTWNGTNTNWYDPLNWSNGVPFSGYKAIIPTGLVNYPSIPTAAHLFDLDVANGANLTLTANAHLTIYDEWVNAGNFSTNVGMVEFRTCVDTSRWSSTTNVNIFDVKVNNEKSLVISNGNMHILDSLIFKDGIIFNGTNEIIFEDNTSWKWASDTSYVNGQVQKTGNDAFVFPVGKENDLQIIAISAPSNVTDHFTAEYFPVNPDSVLPAPYTRTLKDPTLNHVSGCEYWILDRTRGNSNVSVTLNWDINSCGVTNLGDLRVARWDGALWRDHGNGGTTGSLLTGTIITSAPVNSFSPFTLASSTNENPLPIELLSFDAQLNNRIVDLTWQTATEINNDYFTVEKSKDGFVWIAVAEQPGAGNSNTFLNYNDVDLNPFIGVSYYKLKQTDYNGNYTYSNIVSINTSEEVISVYPNPVKDILIINNLNETHIIKVFAIDGRIIFKGNSPTLNTSDWSNGIYELIIFKQNGEIAEKIKIVK